MDFPKSVPSVGLVNGRFVDEDTNTATPGSLIPAAWGNAVTGEIINVIEQAGLEPTEGQNDQLFSAISQLISENLSGQATEAVAGVAKIASDADFTAAVADDTKMVTVQKIKTWFSTVMKQATEAAFGWAKIATQTQTNSGADDTTIVTPKKLSVALSALIIQATEAVMGLAKIATQVATNAGIDDATMVTPKKLNGRLTGQTFTGIAMVAGTPVTLNHSLGVVPSKIEFSLICTTAQNGWAVGDTIHGTLENQSNPSTGNAGMGVFWYGETTTQVIIGMGNGSWLQPVKGTGSRAAITLANFTLTARIIP